jgi:excisionase family DNA binding protein
MGKLGAVMYDSFNPSNARPRQVAARYDVTVPTVLNWFHAGIIPAKVAVGRIYRFDLDEVDRALKIRSAALESSNRQSSDARGNVSKHGRAVR